MKSIKSVLQWNDNHSPTVSLGLINKCQVLSNPNPNSVWKGEGIWECSVKTLRFINEFTHVEVKSLEALECRSIGGLATVLSEICSLTERNFKATIVDVATLLEFSYADITKGVAWLQDTVLRQMSVQHHQTGIE